MPLFFPFFFLLLPLFFEAVAFGFLPGARTAGQGSGMNRPKGRGSALSNATKMSWSPWAKQLCKRGRDRWVLLRCLTATCSSGKSANVLHGKVASASPPRLPAHNVATAMASHKRLARAGSVILV